MSKVRDLPEKTSLVQDDILYVVDEAAGPNGGRKAKVSTIKTAVELTSAEVKTKYEANDDTNAFTDADKLKLDTINNEYVTTVVSGRVVHFTGGKVHYNGVLLITLAGDILLNANIANAHLYVDVDGVVKQTGASSPAPVLTWPIAKFTTDATDVVSLVDHRVFINRNLDAGEAGTITSVAPDNSAVAGASGTYADAAHVHPLPTGTPVGVSASSSNAAGVANTVAKSDHTHAVATGAPSTQNADQANAAGSSSNLAKADHVHNIPTAAPSNTGTANAQGSAGTFAKSDHVHNTVIANTAVTATIDDTTASLTDVLIVGMSITPAAGTYSATFSGSGLNSGNGASRMFFSIYTGGVQEAHSERELGISGGANVAVHTNAVVTVNGSQAIEARWRAVAGTNTVHERSLTLIRLG